LEVNDSTQTKIENDKDKIENINLIFQSKLSMYDIHTSGCENKRDGVCGFSLVCELAVAYSEESNSKTEKNNIMDCCSNGH
jgi:hypothetical protein